MDEEAQKVYARAALGGAVSMGARPAVLVVDLINGFTDPNCRVGADLSKEVDCAKTLLMAARGVGVPVYFTTIAYQPDLSDLGLWQIKVPGLVELTLGSPNVEVDRRLERRDEEPVIVKRGASAFFGTDLAKTLRSADIDSLILCGASTSGCVRASAVDAMQYEFPTLVPQECVGDRARAPHHANLFDIDAKYANVVALEQVLAYIGSLA
ncbi:isochorismatase family protein [Rhodococcus fascians]|nr:isochorismatase family protein [Rhodococcus fascians]